MTINYDNKGIPLNYPLHFPMYVEISDSQFLNNEYKKINMFIVDYLKKYCEDNNVLPTDLEFEFINYGKTELVFVLTDKDKKYTILIKQPIVTFGDVKKEVDNLIELNKKDKNVIRPIEYYSKGDQELYITPYINQARCVASCDNWGMYIPEPTYRFEVFKPFQKQIVNRCMISKLISLYDLEKCEGLSNCKLGGGDFMLPKGWEEIIPRIDTTLDNLLLIAARDKIHCSLNDYIGIIKDEFSRSTINEDQSNIIINKRGRVPMEESDINNGIEIGIEVLEKNNKGLKLNLNK